METKTFLIVCENGAFTISAETSAEADLIASAKQDKPGAVLEIREIAERKEAA